MPKEGLKVQPTLKNQYVFGGFFVSLQKCSHLYQLSLMTKSSLFWRQYSSHYTILFSVAPYIYIYIYIYSMMSHKFETTWHEFCGAEGIRKEVRKAFISI